MGMASTPESSTRILHQPIGIIGAGVAGLICAHVLLEDGFTDVTLLSRDRSVGGTWARERIYPGLHINNVHGEYRFSALSMPPPADPEEGGGRLSGEDIRDYAERFTAQFLEGKAKFKFRTEVRNVARGTGEKEGWDLLVEELGTGRKETVWFAKIILASGGCSAPSVPPALSQKAANEVGYRGIVVHSTEFASRVGDILAAVAPISESKDAEDGVAVVGGGKSAQDICTHLANQGRKVTMVFPDVEPFVGGPKPLPAFLRQSRFIAVLTPHIVLKTRLEWFLHQTSLGSTFVHWFFKKIQTLAADAFALPLDSPLRSKHNVFWCIRLSDEGVPFAKGFHALADAGKIGLVAPAHVIGYAQDGESIRVDNGTSIKAKAVVLCTGYKSSWESIFTPEVAKEIGIDKHLPTTDLKTTWDYKSLQGGPPLRAEHQDEALVTSIHRGIVPAKNLHKRDFAVAGALFSANPGYTYEVVAHWIASYFREDKMRLPSSTEEAIVLAEERSAWMKARFPNMLGWVNESYSGSYDFWTWPQAADELLEDMYLPSMRSGGNWINWVFKVINPKEIANLTEERRVKRHFDNWAR
ncbi:hypothetical protein NLJ89_g3713 [Agrocybe chaxingu]|uniref:FAD/NAD(P)-binding domain-containing protein n=1 Tax=Agrocybe chaxingu TaxID=84603 RepID=A0A9W8MYD8_9AGAR|nr:hypothetical protein NLJ89_g3713 [Agrocybe chaxingu]